MSIPWQIYKRSKLLKVMKVLYLELTMPKATVTQRQRITEPLDEKVLYICVFVSSVKDA